MRGTHERRTGQIPIRCRCAGCDRKHFGFVPGNVEDVLSLELRCPDCLLPVPISEAIEEVRPDVPQPAERRHASRRRTGGEKR